MNPSTPPNDPLAGLRAYHLPDPVAWWTPAPGWWLLGLILLLSLASLGWWLVRRHRRRAASRAASRELAALHARLAAQGGAADTGAAAAFARDLSKLLRRYAIAAFPRREVAALTDEQWLRFLDRHGGDGQFHQGPGKALVEAPYQRAAEVAPEHLAALVERWIRHNREIRA